MFLIFPPCLQAQLCPIRKEILLYTLTSSFGSKFTGICNTEWLYSVFSLLVNQSNTVYWIASRKLNFSGDSTTVSNNYYYNHHQKFYNKRFSKQLAELWVGMISGNTCQLNYFPNSPDILTTRSRFSLKSINIHFLKQLWLLRVV